MQPVMKFYRRLRPIAAISFDLDDTLYNNKPVLIAAEHNLLRWLGERLPAPEVSDRGFWQHQKRQQLASKPELIHNTTELRRHCLLAGLIELGHGKEAEALVAQAMTSFLRWRSEIALDTEVVETLNQLAQRWPLAAITNGNADLEQFWPDAPFSLVLKAGVDGDMKPSSQLFDIACQRLNIDPSQLLHIGDHPKADVHGANLAGCQSGWLTPPYGQAVRPLTHGLPTLAFADLKELLALPTTG
ncbi:HAD family hydrolase [Ferrimonas aestuarii]|uniref:HAD family hydrolase n=2 Tax=Ferrimonas aestuarii TaxID=2569539 RepID=A0A4U1BPR7_9GAMM|nr:HAD family hydrolase [Ferrimonas aestuarii]